MSQVLTSSTRIAIGYASPAARPSRAAAWAGVALGGLPALFLLMDAGMKLAKPQVVVDASRDVGFGEWAVVPLGVILLACTLLYAFPRTAVLGAVLLTGYLGGAVATHVRLANPLFSHTLFPTYLGAMLWGGLLLRDPRLRALLPWRTPLAGKAD